MANVAVTIRLLGTPSVEIDGVAARPLRGRKAWAVLAYVALAERPVSRRQLAELLFGDADDPMGALRWTLAELRRSIGDADVLRGDPVQLGLDRVEFDVLSIAHCPPDSLLGMRGSLLDGLAIDGCPLFESWLVVAQSQVSAAIEGRLRQAAVGLFAEGRFADAAALASQAVARNALDEGNHELLVRCLAAAGDEAAAVRQVAVCEDIMRRELGIEVSSALRAAARRPVPRATAPAGVRSEIEALVEAGRAAVAAGAVEAGLDCLYRAAGDAAGQDAQLHARALVALGSALVHGVRGRDGEGSIVLHEATRWATVAGDERLLATASRELGFVEVQAGRRLTAIDWLDRASTLSVDDESRAAVLGVHGMGASDSGQYGPAIDMLRESAALAARCGDHRQEAWSLSILGRAHLLRDERAQAGEALQRSIELCESQRWMAFLPWPIALRAELEARAGSEDAADAIDRAWALSCQLGDPCWEGMTARIRAVMLAQQGNLDDATTWLEIARGRCDAVTDTYQWVRLYVLDASVEVASARGDVERARVLVDAMASIAARCQMREMVARAHLHRWRLGEEGGLDAAALLSADVDNPWLHAEIDRARHGGAA